MAHEAGDTKLLTRLCETSLCYKKGRSLRIMFYVISRHFKMLYKGAHKNYIIENVGFSRCSYVLRIALADVLILEILLISEKLPIPVFQLENLTDLYKKQMILHGAATKDTKYVHTTRLKNQMLENVPCLYETIKGKFTLLFLYSEMGRALLKACQSSSHNEEKIITKTTSVINKQLFNNDKIFNEDFF